MISSEERHPSPFALDIFFVGGRRGDDVMEGHLEACSRCRLYVEELERWSDEPTERPGKRAFVPWITAAGAIALAAIAALFAVVSAR